MVSAHIAQAINHIFLLPDGSQLSEIDIYNKISTEEGASLEEIDKIEGIKFRQHVGDWAVWSQKNFNTYFNSVLLLAGGDDFP